jgi:hypothetical protein
MTILAGDIKLVESQVMDDVDNGGGAPTDNVIVDGESNGIFNDISEVDRAGGRVNLRKVFASVQTENTDGYFGSNVIVARPPSDPLVSITLFSTNDVFDRRTNAQDRIESYLAPGPVYSGYLFGNHIAGMAVITLLQREEVSVPVVGDTFVLVAFEGTASEVTQFVRVTDVSTELRTFTDTVGDFKRLEVSLSISDSLREDFPGFDALRYDSSISYVGKTKTYETIVADAARYYGVVPLEVAADLGDFTLKAETVYTQLVPSTRVEVPIVDSRMNQQATDLVQIGDAYTRSLTMVFSTTQAMFVGGSILPGSLSVTRGGVTITDKGGVLIDVTNAEVGTIDYENGVLTLTVDVFGASSGTHTVIFKPAANPVTVTDSIAELVTQEGQRLSYTYTFNVIPARGSLQVSYRALGRWYVLREDGSGVIRGSDPSFGAGTFNFTTGSVVVTLGALPDVGSSVIFTYASSSTSIPINSMIQAGPSLPRAFGAHVQLAQALKPGSVTITWNDGSARTATDSGGVLTGDATGTVNYATGDIMFRPNTLPAAGTTINIDLDNQTTTTDDIATMTDGGSAWTFSLGSAVEPGSVELAVVGYYTKSSNVIVTTSIRVYDNGSGSLVTPNENANAVIGTINYGTGACSINKTLSTYRFADDNFVMVATGGGSGGLVQYSRVQSGQVIRTGTLTFVNGTGPTPTAEVPWNWWGGAQADAVEYRCAVGSTTPDTFNFQLNQLFMPNSQNPYTTSQSFSTALRHFYLGTEFYRYTGGFWIRSPSPTSGTGTNAGTNGVSGAPASLGVQLTSWPTGVSSTPTNVAGMAAPALTGANAPVNTTSLTFRTAVAPLVNGGFSVAANWLDSNTLVTATANSSGHISSGSAPASSTTAGSYGVFGVVNYEMGVATIYFGRRVGADYDPLPEDLNPIIDISDLDIPDVSLIQVRSVQADTLRYNAIGYSYLPLDADLLGLDPVRLPPDGRVPIFRPGSFVVVGHTGSITATVSNSQVIDCGRDRLSRVRVIGNNGAIINTGYTVDLDDGEVTFVDVTGYSQPVTIEHRIEDMMLCSDAQINGQLTFTRPLTHDYPLGSYVSSAYVAGDKRAHVSVLFDQGTWTNVWDDEVIGSPATATYNDILHPIEVTNKGALTERWAIRFINSTNFEVIGEHVGVIATGNTSSDLAPINPASGTPYFTLQSEGWGLGWATGNVLRFNTEGAFIPVWIARTILQGPETVPDDGFTMLIRGDVDHP